MQLYRTVVLTLLLSLGNVIPECKSEEPLSSHKNSHINSEDKASEEKTPDKQGLDLVVSFGDPETALLKVVMYHSLNCIHCKEYLEDTFPKIKEEYIDKGKVYFEVRDYPIDEAALDAARLAWCRQDPKVYWEIAKVLHDQLDENDHNSSWARSTQWDQEIIKILTANGFTTQECQNCLKNEDLKKKILQDCFQTQQKYKLTYTPAFVVDGELIGTTLDTGEIEKLLQKKLGQ